MVRRILLPLLFCALPLLQAQEHPSIHQQQWEYYRDHPEEVGSQVVAPRMPKRSDLAAARSLDGIVYGFHPYWMNGSESNYYYNLLTHIAYMSGDVDTATGTFSTTHNWATANVVTRAKNNGVKVHFAVVLFGGHSALFSSQSKKDNLIKSIMQQVNARNADGVNIDFESISGSQSLPYRAFLKQLGDTLKKYGKELSVELFAVDWNGIFPAAFFTELDAVVDQYFIMLYAYYYSGSSTAGPNAPLRATAASGYHIMKSIKTYLDRGCPPHKLIAGIPNYGNDWPVTGPSRMAATTGKGTSRTYTVAKNNYLDTIPPGNRFFDATYNSPWYRYISGGIWRQTWYEDSLSWAMKFDSIRSLGIAGTGMWALGYDGTEPELWGAIANAYAVTNGVSGTERSPERYTILRNHPNPFNPSTTIEYVLPERAEVTLEVFDMLGRRTALLDAGRRDAGRHTARFDGTGHSSGIYLARLRSGARTVTERMLLLR